MNTDYLNRVLIYLQQEMPEKRDLISLKEGRLQFTVPDGELFQPYYESVFTDVSTCVSRIRNRETDLAFLVRSPNQERDFTVFK